MLDLKMVRSEPEVIAKALAKRGFILDVDTLNALEVERKALQIKSESL